MVTASRTACSLRARAQLPGLWRAFWLAALILGLFYTHGASSESAAAHLSPGFSAAATAAAAPAADHEDAPSKHDDDTMHHAAEDCVSNQPQQGADLPVPGASLLVPRPLEPLNAVLNSRATEADSAATPGRDPAILRV